MKLQNSRILLTGATGGLGQALAMALAQQGAQLILTGRRSTPLRVLQAQLQQLGCQHCYIIEADISLQVGREQVVDYVMKCWGGLDVLLNNAGVSQFHQFASQAGEQIQHIIDINVLAPMQLTRLLLPTLLAQRQGRIVNIGSAFGSIGFAYFASYSASKFALRGFSEALRRELVDTGVGVSYIAPRAIRTNANSAAVYEMAEAVNMKMDEADEVAAFIVRCLLRDKMEASYGWSESFFARLNALWPRLVDQGLRKQNQLAARFAPKTERS